MAFTYNPYTESDLVKKRREQMDANSVYNESESVINARNALNQHETLKPTDWTGGLYGESVRQAMDRINNREKFTYDLNGDMLYQQYKNQYINGGRMAMMDTLGRLQH